MKTLVLFSILLFCHTIAAVNAPTNSNGYAARSYQSKSTTSEGELLIDDIFVVKYEFKDDDSVDFTITVKDKMWFGLGFGKNMNKVDMLVVEVKDGKGTVTDLWSVSEDTPKIDKQQDLTVLDESVSDNEVMVKFNRKLDTGDSDEDVVLKKGESYEWGYGYTKSKETMVEEHAKEGHFKVNFGVDGVPEDSFGSYLVLSLFFLAMLF